MNKTYILEDLNRHLKLCKAHGINVVCVTAHYDKKDAHFSTRISVQAQPELGLTDDHIIMDCLREIMLNWHAIAHKNPDNRTGLIESYDALGREFDRSGDL